MFAWVAAEDFDAVTAAGPWQAMKIRSGIWYALPPLRKFRHAGHPIPM
jgi:hypothetical protein